MLSSARGRSLAIAASVSLLALFAVPAVGAKVLATASDAAGDTYKAEIDKAKTKRSEKLKRCATKPTKARRASCRKAANTAFAKAKEKAADKRDDARFDAMTPEEKSEHRHEEVRKQHEEHRCERSHRDC